MGLPPNEMRFWKSMFFYQIHVRHFAHISNHLYKLLRKGTKFIWKQGQELAIEGLEEILKSPPIPRQVDHESRRPMILLVDTSPLAIG